MRPLMAFPPSLPAYSNRAPLMTSGLPLDAREQVEVLRAERGHEPVGVVKRGTRRGRRRRGHQAAPCARFIFAGPSELDSDMASRKTPERVADQAQASLAWGCSRLGRNCRLDGAERCFNGLAPFSMPSRRLHMSGTSPAGTAAGTGSPRGSGRSSCPRSRPAATPMPTADSVSIVARFRPVCVSRCRRSGPRRGARPGR